MYICLENDGLNVEACTFFRLPLPVPDLVLEPSEYHSCSEIELLPYMNIKPELFGKFKKGTTLFAEQMNYKRDCLENTLRINIYYYTENVITLVYMSYSMITVYTAGYGFSSALYINVEILRKGK